MLTSFWAVSLYAVLSGLSGLSIGRWLLPSDRALDRAWEDGRRRGQGEVSRDIINRAKDGRVFRLSSSGVAGWCDAGSQWDRDGANAYYGWDTDDEPVGGPGPADSVDDADDQRPSAGVGVPELAVPVRVGGTAYGERPGTPPEPLRGDGDANSGAGQPGAGPAGNDPRPGDADAVRGGGAAARDWADELGGIRTQIAVDDATEVLAAQPDPPTPGSFEYYASDWQQKFDQWLAGEMAELAKQRRRYERV